ncbi:MAG: NAD(P)/FAD-dependent oxidoreductase [Polyangiaceae bacterium]
MTTAHFDDLVIGAGMAGLSVAALLARDGRRVGVLEAHDTPGGYAHTFHMGAYAFCAQVHYVFGCGEGETIHGLLEALGLTETVRWVRLDPEGFDHVVVAGERFRIANGLAKTRDRLTRRFPEAARPLRRYFDVIAAIGDELSTLDEVPSRPSLKLVPALFEHRTLLRYMRSTLGELYEELEMPALLRAILAGQCGDYLLPPRDVSLLLHAALVTGYDRGAYYPEKHYAHFVEAIADSIRKSPGCALLLEHPVRRIDAERGRVTRVTTANGRTFTAERVISNVDPKRTAELVAGVFPSTKLDRERLDYTYSAGTITLYLALEGLDLRDHGFGSFNVWHYPHADLDRIYDRQRVLNDLSDPWLFLSTPTLHSSAPGLAPPGHQILEVATSCDYEPWAALRARDRRAYNREKRRVRERILDVIEDRYVPHLRDHLRVRVTGTPATNERFCGAPAGNSYGSALTPANVKFGRGPYRTSLENLWIANATAGFPSVAGAVGAGRKLHSMLRG